MRSALGCAVTFLFSLLANACYGPRIGERAAVEYFSEHRAALELIVERVESCRPTEHRTRPGNPEFIHCTNESGDALALDQALRDAGAVWVDHRFSDDPEEETTLESAEIAVHASGFVTGGVIEWFVYESNPAEHAEYSRDDSDPLARWERMPVTEAPHHWYWKRLSR